LIKIINDIIQAVFLSLKRTKSIKGAKRVAAMTAKISVKPPAYDKK